MALTKEEWYEKLKGQVPSWVFQSEPRNRAIFKGMAAVLAQFEQDTQAQVDETYIDRASGEFLDVHGDERDKERLAGEADGSYAARIKEIKNASNCPDLKAIVDSQLIRGESTIIENYATENFLDRGAFLNRNVIGVEVIYNAFTILVNQQIPEPSGFLNRESFLDREFLMGSNESSIELFNAIVAAVNKEKAFGTVYRLIERPNEE